MNTNTNTNKEINYTADTAINFGEYSSYSTQYIDKTGDYNLKIMEALPYTSKAGNKTFKVVFQNKEGKIINKFYGFNTSFQVAMIKQLYEAVTKKDLTSGTPAQIFEVINKLANAGKAVIRAQIGWGKPNLEGYVNLEIKLILPYDGKEDVITDLPQPTPQTTQPTQQVGNVQPTIQQTNYDFTADITETDLPF